MNAPKGIVDYPGELRSIPRDWEPDLPNDADRAEITKLFFDRSLVDPITKNEFKANDLRDIYRFGWFRTNLNISVGKLKSVGDYPFDAALVPPIVAPMSFFTPSNSKEMKHSLNFFIVTPSSKDEKEKLPKYLREWHKDDIPILRKKFMEAMPWLERRAPMNMDEGFNVWKYNMHPANVQRAHHLAALTWQIMQPFEKSDGFKQNELDSWTHVAYLEMRFFPKEVDRELLSFIAHRIRSVVNLDDFKSQGYQDYMIRYVFLTYYLGDAEAAWNAACDISKARGTEFTKSPLYDYVLEMREDPGMVADMFNRNPEELLQYFKM